MENQNQSLQITQPNGLISEVELKFAEKINEILIQTKQIAFQDNPILKGLLQANAMNLISEALTPDMMRPIEKLFGSSIGIKTDKVYTPEIMKRIFIEATLGGWGIVGNQVNVLAGNMYITKNGYLPRLREFPGLKFKYPFKHHLPFQDPEHKTWSVNTDMEWELNGVKYKETITNPTKRQEGQTTDALWGKADTKCARWLWNKVTGQDTMDDSSVSDFVDAEISNVKDGEKGEPIKATTSNPVQAKSDSKGEEIPTMVSDELQAKFNTWISKSANMGDLIGRAKLWCDTPVAKSAGVIYKLDGVIFTSPKHTN